MKVKGKGSKMKQVKRFSISWAIVSSSFIFKFLISIHPTCIEQDWTIFDSRKKPSFQVTSSQNVF